MGLEKYESKQVQILQPVQTIYEVLSRFSNFTPIVGDKVEGWSATEDACSFKVKGFALNLSIVEREPNKMIKIGGGAASPVDFTFWVQMVSTAESDTRMRLVLHAELNMMMKMMVGGKLQQAMDSIADKIAESFSHLGDTDTSQRVQ